jgi:hypothetical protein
MGELGHLMEFPYLILIFMNKLITAAILLVASITLSEAKLKPFRDGSRTLLYEEEINTKNADGTYHHVWRVIDDQHWGKVTKIYDVTCNGVTFNKEGIKLSTDTPYHTFSYDDKIPTSAWIFYCEVEDIFGREYE